ncbi:MAG: 4-hydroxybenzoate octaprenyltransferase [Pseudomonadales bacterium]
MLTAAKLNAYSQLMRIEKPIGILLLLWPTLIALWIASAGHPSLKNIVVFVVGTFLMRSAGCVINDFADRNFDAHVERTRARPLASGAVAPAEALLLCGLLCTLAFGLVLLTNKLTIVLSFIGLAVATVYPFMKRVTYLPQLVLGFAFSFGMPMAFAAETNHVPHAVWLLVAANLVWTVVYDTFYAMVDRDDDLRIGLKSTAILFGDWDRVITAVLQALCLLLLLLAANIFRLHWVFYIGLFISTLMFIYQQTLIANRQRDACFKAFLHNNWVGLTWFCSTALAYALM